MSSEKPLSEMFTQDELLALAGLDIERGNLEGALAKLKRAVSEPSPMPEALGALARVYAQLRLFERAREYFERYLQSEPGALNETFQLGMVHFDSGRQAEALEVWARTLATMPTHPPALFYTGLALVQQGKAADAKRSLDILLQSAPPDNLYFNRAKELIASMEAQSLSGGPVPAMPYRTEH